MKAVPAHQEREKRIYSSHNPVKHRSGDKVLSETATRQLSMSRHAVTLKDVKRARTSARDIKRATKWMCSGNTYSREIIGETLSVGLLEDEVLIDVLPQPSPAPQPNPRPMPQPPPDTQILGSNFLLHQQAYTNVRRMRVRFRLFDVFLSARSRARVIVCQ